MGYVVPSFLRCGLFLIILASSSFFDGADRIGCTIMIIRPKRERKSRTDAACLLISLFNHSLRAVFLLSFPIYISFSFSGCFDGIRYHHCIVGWTCLLACWSQHFATYISNSSLLLITTRKGPERGWEGTKVMMIIIHEKNDIIQARSVQSIV